MRGGGERGERESLIHLSSYSHTLFKLSNQVTTFNELIDQGTDEDSYRALTALGLLTAVQSLVKATFSESKVLILYMCMRERSREKEGERGWERMCAHCVTYTCTCTC